MATTLGPNQTNISPGVPFFAPAGSGGGAANPNPSFSTISFPASDQLATGIINMNSLLTIQDITTTSTAQFFFVANNGPNRFADGQNNSILTYSPGNITNVSLAASQDGNCYLSAYNRVGSTSALYISSATVNVPGNLAVSSINGAAPGGGALSPDITLSTLTFPLGNQTTQGIIRYNRLLTLDNTLTGNASDFILFNTITPDQARTPPSTTTLLINSSSGGSASISIGAAEDGNNYIVSGLTGATVSTALAPLNVLASGLITSSITVSSINGIIPLTGPETSTLQGQVRELRSTLGMI
jgi:hypothetical protein